MRSFMRAGCALTLILLISACSLFGRKETPPQPGTDPRATKKFEAGLKALGEEKYEIAAKIFDGLVVENPNTELDMIALYNSGAAYEGMGRCQEASERYRSVSRSSAGRYPRIQTQAMLRLSYIYECLGEDTKVIATLIDLRKRSAYLEESVAKAEVPARLAAAYARAGNRNAAEKYFKFASDGVQSLNVKYKDRGNREEVLAQTLYLMGRFNQKDLIELQDGLEMIRSISYLQSYLLQAVELNIPPWSKKSADELLVAYDHVWRIIDTHPMPQDSDPEVATMKQQELQRELTETALSSLRAFRALRLPRDPGPLVARLMDDLGKRENQLQTRLAEIAVTNPLTGQANRREGLKREGRVKSAPTALEKNSKKPTNKPKRP